MIRPVSYLASHLRPLLGALALLVVATPLMAAVRLAPLFRDGVVLQREMPVPVWGRAEPGETVEVTFRDQRHATRADEEGRWRISLTPMAANERPAQMRVAGTNVIEVRDVLVGEVWLCSGQSNMAWTISQIDLDARSLPGVDDPLLRQFHIPPVHAASSQEDVAGAWRASSGDTTGGFSAVAYFFGRELRERLQVPVGIVNSSWGGTQIESWLSPASIQASPFADSIRAAWEKRVADHPAELERYRQSLARWERDREAARAANSTFTRRKPRQPEGPGSRWEPGSVHHAMIRPLVPAALRGIIWYQGEANAGRPVEYADLFPRLIEERRAEFRQDRLPFYFVQLANFERRQDPTGREWAFLREAQSVALRLAATGQAIAIDVGDPADIHPKNKREVGRRLALLALANIHGFALESIGPRFVEATAEGRMMRVRLSHATGLRSDSPDGVAGLELAGDDRVFHPAEGRIDGETLLVTSASVERPVAVRHAFSNNPTVSLRNAAGLPAEPFRSDDW